MNQQLTQEQLEQRLTDFIRTMIHASGKTQTAIAKEVGFKRPNIVSMISQGQTRLPIDKIVPFSRSVGCDSRELARLCLAAYEPNIWKLATHIFDDESANLPGIRVGKYQPQQPA